MKVKLKRFSVLLYYFCIFKEEIYIKSLLNILYFGWNKRITIYILLFYYILFIDILSTKLRFLKQYTLIKCKEKYIHRDLSCDECSIFKYPKE